MGSQVERELPVLESWLSVLGVLVSFETNSGEVRERVHHAYGFDSPGPPGSPRVRIMVDPVQGDDGAATPEARLVEHNLLVLDFAGGHAWADAIRGEAEARVSLASVTAPGFREGVLDHLVLFLVTSRDRCPLHAGAITRSGKALLLAGPSGLGKSSLTYAAMRAGFQVLADDVVYVERVPGARLWSMPPRIHLPPTAARHFPELAGSEVTVRPNGREKICVPVLPTMRAPVPWEGEAALCLLVASTVDRNPERVPPADALAEMRATLQEGFHRFDDVLDDCVQLVASGGCWRLPVSVEPTRLVRRVEALFELIGA
jgi:hypothetical protein